MEKSRSIGAFAKWPRELTSLVAAEPHGRTENLEEKRKRTRGTISNFYMSIEKKSMLTGAGEKNETAEQSGTM
jgi:hypothetical protein